jgi:hypothetical protein
MKHAVTVALAAAVLAVIGPAGQAAPSAVPDLNGETLLSSALPARGTSQATGTCDSSGQSSFHFRVTGEAVGPYPGTFVEEGDFTLGPLTTFVPVAFSATFTITSTAGTVTGSKTLAPDVAPVNTGACGPFSGFVPNDPNSFALQGPTRYTATLPGGAPDSGEAIVSYGDMQFRDLPDTNTFNFVQTFASDAFLGTLGQKTTGGGKIAPDVSFGFSAMRRGLKGNCNVVDHVLEVHVKCIDVTAYAQFDDQATFAGNASVDGVQTRYRIQVVDGGEPGEGVDTFSITTGTGYSASGPLASGNVQVQRD